MTTSPPPAFTLALGSEDLLVERAIDAVVASARAIDPEIERREIDAASAGAAGQIVEACSPTLFGGGAVVVVENAEAASDSTVEAILDAAKDPGSGFTLIVTHAGGARGKKILDQLSALAATKVDCSEIKKGRALGDFVSAEMKRNKKSLTPQAQTFLIAAVGSDVRGLAAACSQLAADVEAKQIEESDVQKYFGGVVDVSSFQIADAVLDRKSSEAIRLLRLTEGNDGSRSGPAVVSSLANSIRQVVAVASAPPGMSDRDLAVAAKVPPWKLRILSNQARRWRPQDLARAVLLLADLDAAVKGGLRDGEQLEPAQKGLVVEGAITTLSTKPMH